MDRMLPDASVVVRAFNRQDTIERALQSLRRQTVPLEVIVVDSGSTDATRALAEPLCDRLITIPTERFTYGHALNLGASVAKGPIHLALSAHCVAPHERWAEHAIALVRRPDIAGACGRPRNVPGVGAVEGLFLQDLEHARSHVEWGFSNHASAWRADVWRQHPFDEHLEAAEDKEWALRVVAAGWRIALDEALYVPPTHAWRQGWRQYRGRHRLEWRALRSFADVPPYHALDLLSDWWSPDAASRGIWRLRVNPVRAVGLLGKYQGELDFRRAARRRT